MGGLPIDPRTTAVIESQRSVFKDIGCLIEETEPDFSDVNEQFLIWRGWGREINQGDNLRNNRDKLKDTIFNLIKFFNGEEKDYINEA